MQISNIIIIEIFFIQKFNVDSLLNISMSSLFLKNIYSNLTYCGILTSITFKPGLVAIPTLKQCQRSMLLELGSLLLASEDLYQSRFTRSNTLHSFLLTAKNLVFPSISKLGPRSLQS